MNQATKVAFSLLVVGLCLGLTIALPSFLMTSVLQPLTVSLWLAWRMIASVDQSTYWALLILICCVWLVRVLPPGKRVRAHPQTEPLLEPMTAISHWQALLRNAQRTEAGEAALRASFEELLAGVIGANRESAGLSLEQKLKQTMSPSAVPQYLLPAAPSRSWHSPECVRPLLVRWRKAIRRAFGMPAGPEQATIDEFITWMESLMEMKHDQ